MASPLPTLARKQPKRFSLAALQDAPGLRRVLHLARQPVWLVLGTLSIGAILIWMITVAPMSTSSSHPSLQGEGTFRRSAEAEAFAERILELNGLGRSARSSGVAKFVETAANAVHAHDAAARTHAKPRENSMPLLNSEGGNARSLAARARPRTAAERTADEKGAEAYAHCGAVPSPDPDGTPLPPIPQLYEPRAPRALWLPAIPFTTDLASPHSFNVDPRTGRSNVRTVFSATNRASLSPPFSASGSVQNHDPLAADFAPRSLVHADFLPPAPMECAAHAARTKQYWQDWQAQQEEQRPLNVLVWHGTWGDTTGNAQKGGPMGELALFTSTLLALTALSANVTFLAAPTGTDLMLQALQRYRDFDILLMDTYSSELLERNGYLAQEELKCRIRSLDYWGTPARQNSWRLPSLHQYVVPFTCTPDGSTDNFLLHMHRFKNLPTEEATEPFRWTEERVQQLEAEAKKGGGAEQKLTWEEVKSSWPAGDSPIFADAGPTVPGGADPSLSSLLSSASLRYPALHAKRFQVLIWGREPKYFQHLPPGLLRALAEVVPLVSLVKAEGEGFFPDVSDLPLTEEGHQRIRHVGLMDQATLAKTMRESALILGVGDPILSFTPLESLQSSTPFLNPRFQPPRQLWMNGDCVVTSQHQYVERLGAPQAWSFDMADTRAAQRVLRTALKWVRETQEQLGGIPTMYPRELEFERLVERLNTNFRMDACKDAGLPPTPASRRDASRAGP